MEAIRLTYPQFLVARWVAGGVPNTRIAKKLGISVVQLEETIETIKKRLGVGSRAGICVPVTRLHWILLSLDNHAPETAVWVADARVWVVGICMKAGDAESSPPAVFVFCGNIALDQALCKKYDSIIQPCEESVLPLHLGRIF